MINSRKVSKIIDGVKFTFECVRSKYVGFDSKVTYSHKWYWGADIFNGKHVAIGGKLSIYNGIKHQVKAAKMQREINER